MGQIFWDGILELLQCERLYKRDVIYGHLSKRYATSETIKHDQLAHTAIAELNPDMMYTRLVCTLVGYRPCVIFFAAVVL